MGGELRRRGVRAARPKPMHLTERDKHIIKAVHILNFLYVVFIFMTLLLLKC